jgi:hypothetical protein
MERALPLQKSLLTKQKPSRGLLYINCFVGLQKRLINGAFNKIKIFLLKITRGLDRKAAGVDLSFLCFEILPLFNSPVPEINSISLLVLVVWLRFGHLVTYKHEKMKYSQAINKHKIFVPTLTLVILLYDVFGLKR